MARNALLLAAALACLATPALAAQPVTINNAANSSSACVVSGYLCVTTAGGGAGAATYGSTAALASSKVLKASAGTLYSFEVQADSTLSAAAWWIFIEDATSAVGNGAITPAKCYSIASGTTQAGGTFASGGVAFPTGITIAVSTTGCFTATSSAHAFISGDYK